MGHRHHGDSVEARTLAGEDRAAEFADPGALEQSPAGRVAQGKDEPGLGVPDFLVDAGEVHEQVVADVVALRERRERIVFPDLSFLHAELLDLVARRTLHEDVSHPHVAVVLVGLEACLLHHAAQLLASGSDERNPLFLLGLTGSFADDENV